MFYFLNLMLKGTIFSIELNKNYHIDEGSLCLPRKKTIKPRKKKMIKIDVLKTLKKR